MANYSQCKVLFMGNKDDITNLESTMLIDEIHIHHDVNLTIIKETTYKALNYTQFEDRLDKTEPYSYLQSIGKEKLYFTEEGNKILEAFLQTNGKEEFRSYFVRQSEEDLIIKKMMINNKNTLFIEGNYRSFAPISYFSEMAKKNNLDYIVADCLEGNHTTFYTYINKKSLKFRHTFENYFANQNKASYAKLVDLLNNDDLLLGAMLLEKREFLDTQFQISEKIHDLKFWQNLEKYEKKLIDEFHLQGDIFQMSAFSNSGFYHDDLKDRNIVKTFYSILEKDLLNQVSTNDKKNKLNKL